MQGNARLVLEEVGKVIKGKDEAIELVMSSILARGHILIEDIPGVGKTTLAVAFSRAMELTERRLQFTPDVLPSDVVGFNMLDVDGEMVYKPGAILCNLLLADEINRTSTKTQSALLEVMEEGQVTVDGVTRQLPNPFIVVATQNPVGSAGTQMLPESQLDRFMIRISMGYPTMEEEMRLIQERQDVNPLDYIQEIISKEELITMQEQVRSVYVDERILKYLSEIVDKTRNHAMLSLGVSPRGTLAFVDMSKGHAFLQGRDHVLPEDIKKVAKSVLSHRLLLNGKARMNHVTEDDIVEEILDKVQAPRL
ncbi:AAA family ATPase [Eubacterium xylanophilum]|uniref:AAA family ATPase n=1 Tax=Eubacterium xylanophilum TaxID=39497 RepID=UPI00047A8794|nr:MoxR family ATPase [Eubacterium xylanophilum]MCR5797139.1 MoxR family ATPase [Eubacterium sp.]